jgi:hypothetical protein
MSETTLFCKCEDSEGIPHNKPMTLEEFHQDGMCSICANQVWLEMTALSFYHWRHSNEN